MKKIILFFYVLCIFHFLTHTSSYPNKIIYYQEEHKRLFEQIDPSTISNKDSRAYTKLHQLQVCAYEHYNTIQALRLLHRHQRDFPIESLRTLFLTKQNCLRAITSAQEIVTTENPAFLAALQATLEYTNEIITIQR